MTEAAVRRVGGGERCPVARLTTMMIVVAVVVALARRVRSRRRRRVTQHLRPPVVEVPRGDGTPSTVRGHDGAELRVVIEGDGPTIVLAHGIAVTEEFWAFTRAGLVDRGFRVITFDQRGHGGSTVGSTGFSVENLAADLASILTDLEVTDAVVVGHSMGGIGLQALLAHHRSVVDERVRHAVICSSTPRNEPAWGLFDRVPVLRAGVEFGVEADVPRAVAEVAVRRIMFGTDPPPAPRLVGFALELVERQHPEHLVGAAAALVDFDLRDRLREVSTPATIVCGTEDRVTLPRGGRESATCLPHAEEIWFEGAGHAVPWERIEEFTDILASR